MGKSRPHYHTVHVECKRNDAYVCGITIKAVSAGHYGQIFTKFVNLIGTEELPDMVVGYQNQLALFNMPGAESLIDERSCKIEEVGNAS